MVGGVFLAQILHERAPRLVRLWVLCRFICTSQKLMTDVHTLKLGGAHEFLDMVWTWYWYGMDVDFPISVLPLHDCHDGSFLAARFSAALVWNDGRPFT